MSGLLYRGCAYLLRTERCHQCWYRSSSCKKTVMSLCNKTLHAQSSLPPGGKYGYGLIQKSGNTIFGRCQRFTSRLQQIRGTTNGNSVPVSPTVVPKVPAKRALPKTSEIYRLLSLAKPEKWRLAGDVTFYFYL